MAVHQAQFAHPQRQLAVGVRFGLIDQHPSRAVHRLHGISFTVNNGIIHIVLVMIPMAGTVPKLLIEDDRRGDLNIAVALVHFAPVFDERVLQHHALGQEEGKPGPLVAEHEEVQLSAQLPVVARFSLFAAGKVSVQLSFFREAGPVDTLEHLRLESPRQ